jgi:hypothetical protein
MTILAGFSSSAGAILCADTQETVGYAKRNVSKIEVSDTSGKEFRVAIAAAGNGPYADKLTQGLFGAIGAYKEYDPGNIISAIENTVTEFHSKHIWPRTDAQYAPQVELLILLQPTKDDVVPGFPGYPLLLHVAETAVNIVQETKSVGIGSWLADYILDRLHLGYGNRNYMVALGAYLMKEVRENVEGCGKDAELMFFGSDGKWEDISGSAELMFLENHVEEINSVFSTVFFRIGQIPLSIPSERIQSCSEIDHVIKAVEQAREEYAEVIHREEEAKEQQRREMAEYRRKHPDSLHDDIPF